ncbi:MAG: hypothetical protein ACRC76_00240 [Proteocatella sp.]
MDTINFNIGDTNFLALVNKDRYISFVNEEWDLPMLGKHWDEEAKKGNILVFGMTAEGIERDWIIEIEYGENDDHDFYRKTQGYINVTEGMLNFVEFTCLTMAAQFKDNKVPDEFCEPFRVQIENGLYKVEVVQYYNADSAEHIGRQEIDMQFNFIKQEDETVLKNNNGLYWFSI